MIQLPSSTEVKVILLHTTSSITILLIPFNPGILLTCAAVHPTMIIKIVMVIYTAPIPVPLPLHSQTKLWNKVSGRSLACPSEWSASWPVAAPLFALGSISAPLSFHCWGFPVPFVSRLKIKTIPAQNPVTKTGSLHER